METKPKKVAEKDKSADKKSAKEKGKGEQRENRPKWLKKLKNYLQKTETKIEENPASDEAGEEEAKSD